VAEAIFLTVVCKELCSKAGANVRQLFKYASLSKDFFASFFDPFENELFKV